MNVLFAFGLMFGGHALAQTTVAPILPSSQDTPANLGPDGNRGVGVNASTQSAGSLGTSADIGNTVTTLPASQIIAILQQRPEVVVELKSLLADQMQQQGGVQVQSDSITDEMLYDQIVASPDVRTHVTTFLRARGYISDDTLQAQASSIEDVETAGGSPFTQPTGALSGSSRLSSGDSQARVGAATGVPSLDGANTSLLPGAMAPSLGKPTAKRRDQVSNASTDIPKVLRSPAPYNLQSMRDLYTQIPEPSVPLRRFGSEVFVNSDTFAMTRGVTGRDTPLDVPIGPDYILGPGDTLTITLWGGVSQTMTRLVDRDGRILLPEGGSIDVAGLALSRAQSLIEGVLKQQYRNAQIAVTVSQLRSVRVYVVGDVQRPGGFDISSLATPLSALYAAGGPTAAGSLRTLRHLRGKQLIEEVDLYDFLLHGLRNQSARFESGDTLLVPPAGPQVAISGGVKRPAIYELKGGEATLASVPRTRVALPSRLHLAT